MTDAPESDIGKRMGRPPLNVKETKVRLTDEQRRRMEALVGTYGMARFIREAIDAELERREQLRLSGHTGDPDHQG